MLVQDFIRKYNVTLSDVAAVLQTKGMKAHLSLDLSDHLVVFLKKRLSLYDDNSTSAQNVTIKSGAEVKPQEMLLGDLAGLMGCNSSEVIVYFLKKGVVANKNKMLSVQQVVDVATAFGASVQQAGSDLIDRVELFDDAKEAQDSRLPIVVVMGHVDHGKTTLLDYVRKTKVADKEAGGITQHLGAYEVATSHGNIIFLDTPGHEAFSMMRERGALVADVVVLVVAADDGVMPQTRESVEVAKSLDVPIVVAMNKADKASQAQMDEVKRQLAELDVLPDDWGGQTPFLPVSGKTGDGVDHLLEIIALQADMMDLKTSTSIPARGYILESRVEKGRGSVATVILKEGMLSLGDYFLVGNIKGRVSSLVNDRSEQLKSVGPSIPVLVAGFDKLPSAGDVFKVVPFAEYKRFAPDVKKASLHKAFTDDTQDSINIFVKASTISSLEAVIGQLRKIKLERVRSLKIVDSGVGDITESNILFAQEANALIVGLDVKVNRNADAVLKKSGVEVKLYSIIYNLVDDIYDKIKATQLPDYEITQIGTGFVKAVFRIKSTGVIAGVHVESGEFRVGEHVYVFRKGKKIAEGTIKTLQQDKKVRQSVHEGNDCAFILDGFNDWQEGDKLECISKKLKS